MNSIIFTPFGYEVYFLNTTITTATDSKFDLKGKSLIKTILRLTGLPHFGARVRAFHLNKILDQLDQDSNLLDAGCGIGLNSFLAARKGFKVLGIDNDKIKIESAKYLLSKNRYDNINFKLANILQLSKLKQKFESVICFEVLEHVKDDKKAVQEISNILTNNGKLILSVPGRGFISLTNQYVKHHVREGYNLEELENLLTRADLKIRNVIAIEHTHLGLFLRYVNDAIHKKSLLATTLLFFLFFPLAIFDQFLPKIVTPQNWVIVAEKK